MVACSASPQQHLGKSPVHQLELHLRVSPLPQQAFKRRSTELFLAGGQKGSSSEFPGTKHKQSTVYHMWTRQEMPLNTITVAHCKFSINPRLHNVNM